MRKQGFELTNGTDVIAAIPKVDGEYDLKTLSELALSLKRDIPTTDDASVLLEPEIPYDDLIQVMDAIRSTEATAADRRAGVRPGRAVHEHRRRRCANERRPVLMSLLGRIRSKTEHHLRHRVDAELNLIPLIDILSVHGGIPARVLRGRRSRARTPRACEIPQSTAEAQPNQSVVVMITKDQLFVQGELVANIGGDPRPGER